MTNLLLKEKVSILSDIDTDRITSNVFYAFMLSFEKVISDTTFTPEKDSYEYLIKEMLKDVESENIDKLNNQFSELFNAKKVIRKFIYNEYSDIDHKKSKNIKKTIDSMFGGVSNILGENDSINMSDKNSQEDFKNSKKGRSITTEIIDESYPYADIEKLSLYIESVKCIHATRKEAGSDEIYLGGVSVDEDGTAKKIDAIEIHDDFDTGEEKIISPHSEFTWFSLNESTGYWPRKYLINLILFEKDCGGMGKFLANFTNALANAIAKEVAKYLSKSGQQGGGQQSNSRGLGMAILGACITSATAAVMKMLVDWLTHKWNDDYFPPMTDNVDIHSLDEGFEWLSDGKTYRRTETKQINFVGLGGQYQLKYYWKRTTDKEQLKRLAYKFWENRGRPMGDPWADWFKALNYVGIE